MRDGLGADMAHLVQSPPIYARFPPDLSELGVNGVYTIIGKASGLADSYAAHVNGNHEMDQPYSIAIDIECTAILQIDAGGTSRVVMEQRIAPMYCALELIDVNGGMPFMATWRLDMQTAHAVWAKRDVMFPFHFWVAQQLSQLGGCDLQSCKARIF